MSSISTALAGSASYGANGAAGALKPILIDQVLDLGNISHSAGDDIQALPIKAGQVVLASGIEVITGDTAGNSGTIVNRLTTTARGSATAPTATGFTAALFSGTVAQAASDTTINVLTATGTTNAVIRVWALVQSLARGTGAKAKVVNSAAVYTNAY